VAPAAHRPSPSYGSCSCCRSLCRPCCHLPCRPCFPCSHLPKSIQKGWQRQCLVRRRAAGQRKRWHIQIQSGAYRSRHHLAYHLRYHLRCHFRGHPSRHGSVAQACHQHLHLLPRRPHSLHSSSRVREAVQVAQRWKRSEAASPAFLPASFHNQSHAAISPQSS